MTLHDCLLAYAGICLFFAGAGFGISVGLGDRWWWSVLGALIGVSVGPWIVAFKATKGICDFFDRIYRKLTRRK